MRSIAGKASASEQIRHHLRKSAAWQAARVVFGFVALPGEPDWLGEDLPADKILAFMARDAVFVDTEPWE